MPIHPGMVEPLAEQVRDLYAAAEVRLLGIIARQLAAGLDAPSWAERKLGAIQQVRRASQAVVTELGQAVTLDVHEVIAEAYNEGHRAGVAELGALSDDAVRMVDDVLPQAQAVDRLAVETVDRLTATHRSILRAVDDGYRAVVAAASAEPLLGTATRRQATQDAMRAFADRGITGFRDRAGRPWSLTAYAEMTMRTSVGRAATEAHMQTLATAGVDLVIVSDSPRECPLCRPWERQVLTVSGPAGARDVEVEHATRDGETVTVHVAGSLDEARQKGLQHPNCRHSVSAFTPGLTRVDDAKPDPDGYVAGQRQREIERTIRKYKRRAATAMNDRDRQAAEARTRQWQAAMRQHLADHPDLRRNRVREQEGAGNLPPEQRTPARGQEAQQRPEVTPEQLDAARVWSGDDRTMREMTDEQLAGAVRAGPMDARALARVEAEADRRDLDELAERSDRLFPGGHLARDLADVGDDDLAWAMQHATAEELLRIAAEMDRRDGIELPPPASTGNAVDDLLADRDALAEAMSPAPDPAGWGALADDASFARDAARLATAHDEDGGSTDERHLITRREAREMYDEYVMRQYLAAEDATNGYLLNRKARADGIDPGSLFSGPARIAYARASDELKEWWAANGRLTQAEFIEQVTGKSQRWASGARKNEADQQNRR
ncbi:MuF-like minor capsid protein [Streptomyces phage SV1]|uniref:head morphogenesis n=1 Tax=Streptomyces phage SV1 TaxID=1204525 RepID=UPI00028A5C41|nr:head morphogenesis [Streptomyces phage SV1]AFU62144.1 MuF-like minor capsid protein [Streptomyces phage SV1]